MVFSKVHLIKVEDVVYDCDYWGLDGHQKEWKQMMNHKFWLGNLNLILLIKDIIYWNKEKRNEKVGWGIYIWLHFVSRMNRKRI